jgi:hypothetical protein
MYTLKVHSPIRIGFYPKNILRQQKTLINKHKGDVRVYIYIYIHTRIMCIYIYVKP